MHKHKLKEKLGNINPYTDEDVFYSYNSEEQMQLRLLKELMPERMKYILEIRKKSTAITENAMANAADNLFIGLYGTYQSVILHTKSHELAKKSYQREKIRYENGFITAIDLNSGYLENQLKTITGQFNSGLVPEAVIEQIELAVNQFEFITNMSMISAMNESDRLYRAISTGPGY